MRGGRVTWYEGEGEGCYGMREREWEGVTWSEGNGEWMA